MFLWTILNKKYNNKEIKSFIITYNPFNKYLNPKGS